MYRDIIKVLTKLVAKRFGLTTIRSCDGDVCWICACCLLLLVRWRQQLRRLLRRWWFDGGRNSVLMIFCSAMRWIADKIAVAIYSKAAWMSMSVFFGNLHIDDIKIMSKTACGWCFGRCICSWFGLFIKFHLRYLYCVVADWLVGWQTGRVSERRASKRLKHTTREIKKNHHTNSNNNKIQNYYIKTAHRTNLGSSFTLRWIVGKIYVRWISKLCCFNILTLLTASDMNTEIYVLARVNTPLSLYFSSTNYE